MCDGLNMKSPPQAHVLITGFPAGSGIILRYSGKFRRWGLLEEVGHRG